MIFLVSLVLLSIKMVHAIVGYDYGFANVTGITFGDDEKVNFTLQVDTEHFQIADTDVLNPSSVFTDTDYSYFEAVIGVLDTAYKRDDFNEKSFLMQLGDPMRSKSSSPPLSTGVLSRITGGLNYGIKQGKSKPKSYCRIEESDDYCVSWSRDVKTVLPFYSSVGESCTWHCFRGFAKEKTIGLRRSDCVDFCSFSKPEGCE